MKLKEKIRDKGKIHRRYDTPETPYQRVMESDRISETRKNELKALYLSLNPAELKRGIEMKLKKLHKAYQKKNSSQNIEPFKKQTFRTPAGILTKA